LDLTIIILIFLANSLLFRAILDCTMLEAGSSVIEIPDFDVEPVQGMLRHIYTGETYALDAPPEELVRIADKNDLSALKKDNELSLSSKVTVQNAAELLVFADLHRSAGFKKSVMAFNNK